jgi:hypothetical protein
MTSKTEKLLVCALVLAAMVRVGIYATFIPALTKPDEVVHYDRVLSASYSLAGIHPGIKPVSREAIVHSMPFIRGVSPLLNQECCEPPLYYALMGCWHNLGSLVVWRPYLFAYWDRLSNVFLAGSNVLLGYLIARKLFDGSARMIVPLFLAFLPQSDLYGIDNDALVPLVFGLFIFAYAEFSERQTVFWSVACGLTLAVCAWVKTLTAPLIVVGGLYVIWTILHSKDRRRSLIAFLGGACVLVPLVLWNLAVLGVVSGGLLKLRVLRETYHWPWIADVGNRPVIEWFRHPVFRPRGFVEFFVELTNTFYYGEQSLTHYYGFNVKPPWWILWICPVMTCVVLWRSWSYRSSVVSLCRSSWVGSVLFLMVSSAVFVVPVQDDSPSAFYEFPGFVGGRLMIGAMIPFAILIGAAYERTKFKKIAITVLLLVLVVLNATSAWLFADAFNGHYRSLWF